MATETGVPEMTIADVLTDEMIERVAAEVYDRLYRAADYDNPRVAVSRVITPTMARTCVRSVLESVRAPTFRFVVKVKGEEARTKIERLRQMEGVNVYPIPGGAVESEPIPATDQMRYTVTWVSSERGIPIGLSE